TSSREVDHPPARPAPVVDHHPGEFVAVDDFQRAIRWLDANKDMIKKSNVKTGGCGIPALIKVLQTILGLVRVGAPTMEKVVLPRKGGKKKKGRDPEYIQSAGMQANRILQIWAERHGHRCFPSISRSDSHLDVRWELMPTTASVVQEPRRVWWAEFLG